MKCILRLCPLEKKKVGISRVYKDFGSMFFNVTSFEVVILQNL